MKTKPLTPAAAAATLGLPEGLTQEMINNWKKEFKTEKLNTITIKGSNGAPDALAVLKPLRDRNVIALALSKATAKDIVGAGAVVYANCKLWADPRIDADDNMYVTACVMANQLNELPEADLGNL